MDKVTYEHILYFFRGQVVLEEMNVPREKVEEHTKYLSSLYGRIEARDPAERPVFAWEM